jgi:hypothetical protein
MRLIASRIFLIAALTLCGSASMAAAQQSSETGKKGMEMLKPGPEMAAIHKLFGHGATWEGKVPAGALGPDSPATTSRGRAICGPIVEGFWCRCEVVDTMGSGKETKTWRGHMIVGYDLAAKAYRGLVVDNLGGLTMYNTRMEGGTLTLETPEPVPFMGVMQKDRLTFVAGPDGMMASFKDEHKVGDGGWTAFETVEHIVPLGVAPRAEKAPGKAGKAE